MLNNYYKDENGVIHQINRKRFVYDEKYVSTYNNFKQKTREMAYLRLGYLIASIGHIPEMVCDYGYGNGSFLEVCEESGIKCFGTDISDYPIPLNCTYLTPEEIKSNYFDVLCFFDCLEHIEDLSLLGNINSKFIYISLPWCHHTKFGDEWFEKWKHKKPNEHLHHFDDIALKKCMSTFGYECITTGNPEDCVRKSTHPKNILSGVFKKRE